MIKKAKFKLIQYIYSLIFIILIVKCESIDAYKNPSFRELSKLFFKVFKSQKYNIIDTTNKLTNDEKEVISYRLDTLYNKLKFNVFIFIVEEFSTKNLDTFKENDFDSEEFNFTINNSTEDNYTRKNDMKKYVLLLKNELIKNDVIFREKDNLLIFLLSLEDIASFIYTGLNVKNKINEYEIDTYLKQVKDGLKKNGVYETVDMVMNDIVYQHCPSIMDNFFYYLTYVGEVVVFIVIMFAFSYTNNNNNNENDNENDDNQNENNDNENDKDNKNTSKKKNEKNCIKEENNKKDEKENNSSKETKEKND